MAEIPIYGTLVNATTEPKIVNTDQAWDKELGKYQSEINKERSDGADSLKAELDTLSSKVDKEILDRDTADAVLSIKIDDEIQDRTDADAALKTELTGDIQEVQTTLDDFLATKGQANGLASLDENGKVPVDQLPSYVDDVIDVYATYDKSETGELSNIALFADAEHNIPIVGESGKIYQNVTEGEPSYQFRWTGTIFAHITSGGVVIGEITGTAYDGAKGKAMADTMNSLPSNITYDLEGASTNSVYNITKRERVKVGNTYQLKEDPDFLQIPSATSTKAGVMAAADKVKLDDLSDQVAEEIATRESETTALQNNLTKEVNDRKGEIIRVEGLISAEAATRAQADTDVNNKIDTHIINHDNPHEVTKAQVGLSNVNNTSDADKPVSTAQATAIADAKAAGTLAQTNLTTHLRDKSNPHQVTRDQLGMGTDSEIVFKKVSAPSGLWKESDERLKSFIKPLEHTLDEICSIPTDSFIIRGSHDIGTIAQVIEKHFPELVSENTVKPETVPNPEVFETIEKDGETYILVKEVDYSKMSVLAIEGIKLLKERIEDLEKKLLFTNLD